MQVVSVLFAAVAACAALAAVVYARRTVTETVRARVEAERGQTRQRLEAIGAVVEEIYWRWTPERTGVDPVWSEQRNRLARLLVGLDHCLPVTSEVVGATNPEVAHASKARSEIKDKLRDLGATGSSNLDIPE